MVALHLQGPDLKPRCRNFLVIGLNERDFIDEPIRAGTVGNIFCAVGKQHFAIDAVAVPTFCSGEMPEFITIKTLFVTHESTFLVSCYWGAALLHPWCFAEKRGSKRKGQ